MTDKIPSDVVTLADAYGMHIRALGKYWALASTIAVVAFTADASTGLVEVFGFNLKGSYFYPACAAFGAILNFAYCISHLQAYRAGEIFRGYLSSIGAAEQAFTASSNIMDAAHTLYPSAINRVYPVFHFLPANVNKKVVLTLKLPVDLFVFLLPISGCVYAAAKIESSWWSVALWGLVLISCLMTILLTYSGIRWLFHTDSSA